MGCVAAVTSSQRGQCEKGGERECITLETRERHDLSQVIKANVSCDAMLMVRALDVLR